MQRELIFLASCFYNHLDHIAYSGRTRSSRSFTSCIASKSVFLLVSYLRTLYILMALAKDRTLDDPQARSFYGGGASFQSLDHPPSLELFSYKSHVNMMLEEGESSESLESYSSSILPLLSDNSNYSSSSYPFGAINPPQQEAHAVNFKAASEQWVYSSSSAVLSFDQGDRAPCASSYLSTVDNEEECTAWMDAMDQNYQLNHLDHMKHGATDSRLIHDQNRLEMASGYNLSLGALKDKRYGNEDRFELLYPGANVVNRVQENVGQVKNLQKRAHTDSDLPSPKKQCVIDRKSKAKPSPSKDPQSIAAKNRRERVSDRLKVLQDLVPNGTKVDMVTMLEKAISYVKFLQLQVKVLATDEFWPAQGGKAPELSQVKEALDAILSSQRDGNSSSKQ